MGKVGETVGEIRLIAGEYIPVGWMRCDGQGVPRDDYLPLYSVIGGTYGEDGGIFFLPDLRGVVPVGVGSGPGLTARRLGERGGNTIAEIPVHGLPPHSHQVNVSNTVGTTSYINRNTKDGGTVLANMEMIPGGIPAAYTSKVVAEGEDSLSLMRFSIETTGEGMWHNNIMPTAAMTYIICYAKMPE